MEVDADISSEYAEFEEIMGAAVRAYFIKLGIDPDYGRFYEEFDKHPLTDSQKAEIASEIEFAPDMDKQWEENDLDKWLPKLYEMYK